MERFGETLVRFRGVRKSFESGIRVIDDLDLDIRAGEFLTLLGPSGSGKTTVLMMLAGFETPNQGDILIAGQSIVRTPPNRRDIGMVFQSYALFPHMTVAENVAFPLKVRGCSAAVIADRSRQILAMVGLETIAQRLPTQLSGGQQQRVAVARALVFEPRIVLMDEPLAALDKQLRERMQIEIRALHDKIGVTTIYVTHDQTEALTMSDRVAVFNGGQIQQIAEPHEVYEHPANTFVAGFIGDNSILQCIVISTEGGSTTISLGGGDRVEVRPGAGLSNGATVSLAIRPERIRLGTGAGGLSTTVEQVVYAGDRLRLRCQLAGGQSLVATTLVAGQAATLRPGDSLRLELPAEHCRIFPREG